MYERLAEKLADSGWCNTIPLKAGTKRALVPWRQHRLFIVTDAEREEYARRFPDAGIGYILEPNVVAVEADVLDLSAAERLGALADKVLGPTPLVRIGRPPKWMRFYSTVELLPKIAAHPIEVIPGSYHVVLYGIHESTRHPYFWMDGEPLDTPPESLPLITRGQVERFVAAALEIVPPRRRASLNPVNGDLFAQLRDERAGRVGMAWLAVVERQLCDARPGELHDTLLSVSAALVSVGYDDTDINAIVQQHFAAPRSGPYAGVWTQIDDAIAGARLRWTPRTTARATAPANARLRMVSA